MGDPTWEAGRPIGQTKRETTRHRNWERTRAQRLNFARRSEGSRLGEGLHLGYSFWGFLGGGIADTPDGGRSHRWTLLRALMGRGVRLRMLQKDRDFLEAGERFADEMLTFDSGFPAIDALFMEYRWPIPGRNTEIDRTDPRYTPDYDRQNELLEHYLVRGVPIFIWDKDVKMPADDPLVGATTVFEASLYPRERRNQLLFPVDMREVEAAQAQLKVSYSRSRRRNPLIYIGNQYERDESFAEFVDKAAGRLGVRCPVYGNWTKYPDLARQNVKRFPNVRFRPRVAYPDVRRLYDGALATVLISTDRCYKHGQFTQRLFESVLRLCVPLTPDRYAGVGKVAVPELIVGSGDDVAEKVEQLRDCAEARVVDVLREQASRLRAFDVNAQVPTLLEEIYARL